ncbi:hypothetical protein LR48_Vigan02g093100 [Vigna angularis]|uniref:Uncharacterized protein n=1 Tax=Phaseolus angularis TaxID=3914 RepID=A0A0L9TWA8_PHAAN|nr:hypothetical protein LR48_Vigan02g093100 [Vigna angularis]
MEVQFTIDMVKLDENNEKNERYMDTIIVESGRASVYGFLHRKINAELKSLLQTVVTMTRGQQLEIIYPKNDSWAYGYYIMSWIKAIIRAEIRGEWTTVEIYI